MADYESTPDYEKPYPDDGKFHIIPDYSVRLNLRGVEDRPEFAEGLLINPRYDSVVIYPKIGSAILRCVMDEGMAHLLMSEEVGRFVADQTGIPLTEETRFMIDKEYELYIKHKEKSLDDSWLGDTDGE